DKLDGPVATVAGGRPQLAAGQDDIRWSHQAVGQLPTVGEGAGVDLLDGAGGAEYDVESASAERHSPGAGLTRDGLYDTAVVVENKDLAAARARYEDVRGCRVDQDATEAGHAQVGRRRNRGS